MNNEKIDKSSESIIDIVSYNALEYIFECLARFNSGDKKVILRAYGGNIIKGIEVSQILQKEVPGITVEKCLIDSICIGNKSTDNNRFPISFIEIHLKAGSTPLDKNDNSEIGMLDQKFENMDFIYYSTYHLLFDWYLKRFKKMKIKCRDSKKKPVDLLDIQEENGIRQYKVHEVFGLEPQEYMDQQEVNKALYRSGLLMPEKWQDIGKSLSRYDDIILGLDTNILQRCSITSHLLPALSLMELKEFVHTPNWILLIVPSTVMFELEEATNIRDERGLLRYKGRMGFRALQEIKELSENIDIPGVSLLIHGETNPLLDTKSALSAIRRDMADLKQRSNYTTQPPHKSAIGDMTIRTQFKKFLNQIDFHKGTFFLTADKSSGAMAQAEGLHPIYLSYPDLLSKKSEPFTPVQIPGKADGEGKQLTLNVPLGSIIYELAVSFGEIIISCGDISPSLECDRRGEDIGCWVHKQLRISKNDLTMMLKDYSGKFNLANAAGLNKKITNRLETVEWLTEMRGAFKCA